MTPDSPSSSSLASPAHVTALAAAREAGRRAARGTPVVVEGAAARAELLAKLSRRQAEGGNGNGANLALADAIHLAAIGSSLAVKRDGPSELPMAAAATPLAAEKRVSFSPMASTRSSVDRSGEPMTGGECSSDADLRTR